MSNDTDNTGDVTVTIEGRGETIVDALVDVLLGAQDRLRAIDSAADTRDD